MKLVLEPMDVESGPLAVEGSLLLVGRGIRAVRDEEPGTALLDVEARFTTVSREHARFRREKGAWVVENLGKHGSFVGEEALEGPRTLKDGDLLRFGRGGPRWRVRLRDEDGEVRRCPACLEIVAREEVERHAAACPVLHPPLPTSFAFGPLRSGKRKLLVAVDLSGGLELALAAPALIEALRDPSIRFGVLAGEELLWPELRASTEERRAEARAWLRERAGAALPPAALLRKALEVPGAEAVLLLAAGEAEGLEGIRAPREIHVIGLGPRYAVDGKGQAVLRDLAARHGGGFFAVAAKC